MKEIKFGVIGCGNMAAAIIGSVVDGNVFDCADISVFDKFPEKAAKYADRGICVCASARDVIANSDIILLSVKPQDFTDLLSETGSLTSGKCLLSIAAGIPVDFIRSRTAEGTYIVRVMPNTPLMLGCGATAIALSPDTPKEYFDRCVNIFKASGCVELMDESLINAVISVNSTSPAYFYRMASVMADYAVSQGIDRDAAVRLAAKAMEGSAKMLLKGEHTADELVKMVASPGGTTIAALNSMDENAFDDILKKAMHSCTVRAGELSSKK